MSSAGKGDRTRTWTSAELRKRWDETFGGSTESGDRVSLPIWGSLDAEANYGPPEPDAWFGGEVTIPVRTLESLPENVYAMYDREQEQAVFCVDGDVIGPVSDEPTDNPC